MKGKYNILANKGKDSSSDYLIGAIAELKMEIKGLRADMNRMEETVLKERLRAVEDSSFAKSPIGLFWSEVSISKSRHCNVAQRRLPKQRQMP